MNTQAQQLFMDDSEQRYHYRQAVMSNCPEHGTGCLPPCPHPLYRYELIERWGTGPLLEWVMLNPSTADATRDDPTIRRCKTFAKQWGYAGILIRNLYAYRATNPDTLVNVEDPIGPLNRSYLANNIADCTIVGWGAHPAAVGWWAGYPYNITSALKRRALYCLGTTASGAPRHPLYVRGDTTPIRWSR